MVRYNSIKMYLVLFIFEYIITSFITKEINCFNWDGTIRAHISIAPAIVVFFYNLLTNKIE